MSRGFTWWESTVCAAKTTWSSLNPARRSFSLPVFSPRWKNQSPDLNTTIRRRSQANASWSAWYIPHSAHQHPYRDSDRQLWKFHKSNYENRVSKSCLSGRTARKYAQGAVLLAQSRELDISTECRRAP